jgi:hypothetical protein
MTVVYSQRSRNSLGSILGRQLSKLVVAGGIIIGASCSRRGMSPTTTGINSSMLEVNVFAFSMAETVFFALLV